MKITARVAFVSALALCLLAVPARAGSFDQRQGSFAGQIGMGFTASDTTFSMGFSGEYFLTENISIVPRFTLDLDNDFTVFTITGDGRYTFDIPSIERLTPFAEAGLGVAIGSIDCGPGCPIDDSDVAFQFEFGGGANYYVTDNLGLGTELLFTFPIGLFEDEFVFQWHVLTARYIF